MILYYFILDNIYMFPYLLGKFHKTRTRKERREEKRKIYIKSSSLKKLMNKKMKERKKQNMFQYDCLISLPPSPLPSHPSRPVFCLVSVCVCAEILQTTDRTIHHGYDTKAPCADSKFVVREYFVLERGWQCPARELSKRLWRAILRKWRRRTTFGPPAVQVSG